MWTKNCEKILFNVVAIATNLVCLCENCLFSTKLHPKKLHEIRLNNKPVHTGKFYSETNPKDTKIDI